MPKLTKEQRLALGTVIDERADQKKALIEAEIKDRERWQSEIAMLERRVKNETSYVDLGNGDKIAIRLCLSDAEMKEISELQKEMGNPDIPEDEREFATFRILEIATANPLLTVDWFRDNRNSFATSDMLAVILGFYEAQVEERRKQLDRVRSAGRFRTDNARSELRGISSLHENSGPEGLGGST